MPEQVEYTYSEIAEKTQIPITTIRDRARREKWPFRRLSSGRIRKIFPFDSLPNDIKGIIEGKPVEDYGPDFLNPDKEEVVTLRQSLKLVMEENRKIKARLLRSRGLEDLIASKVQEVFKHPAPIIVPRPPKETGKGNKEIAVAHISDTHIGKITPTYSTRIAKERINDYARRVVEITKLRRNNAAIDELRIYLGGDMIEGEVGNYPSQPYMIDCPVIDQATNHGPEIFESIIRYFLEYFKKIKVLCVVGNHGRGRSRHAVGHPKTSWDRVLYRTLSDRIIGTNEFPNKATRERIEFLIPDSFWVVDRVFEWGNLIVHGNQIKSYKGIPWYGVTRRIHKWTTTKIFQSWDYLWIGHYHTCAKAVVNGKEWLCNGATESDNEYALEELGASGDPCQRLAFFNASKGLISDDPIYLTDRVPFHKSIKI